MGGFFGTVSKAECVTDLFYGTDYNSHLGTKRAGMATYAAGEGFMRAIHSLESSYFRTKFESELPQFKGNAGIGVISDTDPQPIMINSHLGKFAIVTVAKINNEEELVNELLASNMHLSEMSMGKTNQTELVALLIVQGKDFVDGIENVFNKIKGSCSMLILTEDGIIVARDKWGRTPIIIGKKDGAYAATSESSSLPNPVCAPMDWSRCANLMTRCRSALFCGFTMVSLFLHTKEEMLKKSVLCPVTRWDRLTILKWTALAVFLTPV